jgi:hypothetical protein
MKFSLKKYFLLLLTVFEITASGGLPHLAPVASTNSSAPTQAPVVGCNRIMCAVCLRTEDIITPFNCRHRFCRHCNTVRNARGCYICREMTSECPVCRRDMNEMQGLATSKTVLVCNHSFCYTCALKLKWEEDPCPLCRAPLEIKAWYYCELCNYNRKLPAITRFSNEQEVTRVVCNLFLWRTFTHWFCDKCVNSIVRAGKVIRDNNGVICWQCPYHKDMYHPLAAGTIIDDGNSPPPTCPPVNTNEGCTIC